MIKALLLLTDCRLPVDTTVLKAHPGSEMSTHITMDAQDEDGTPMQMSMGLNDLDVILMDAVRMYFMNTVGTNSKLRFITEILIFLGWTTIPISTAI